MPYIENCDGKRVWVSPQDLRPPPEAPCKDGVTGLASEKTFRLPLPVSQLKDSKGSPVMAMIDSPINEDVVLEGDDCVLRKLLREAKSCHELSTPCPKCRRIVRYRSEEIDR